MLLLCEKVIRATLHKFRKSALFSYVQMDTSSSCRDAMRKILLSESAHRDAIFMETDKRTITDCDALIKDVFSTFSIEHSVTGQVVFYPESETFSERSERFITDTLVYSKENIRKTVNLAISEAKKRKRSFTVCLQSPNSCDDFFMQEAELSMAEEKHIPAECICLDEMILKCMRTIPDFDVVLTRKEYAPLITMHLNSLPNIPTGYIVSHCENLKIYKRQFLPSEEITNSNFISSLLALAEILNSEFGMKNASAWLKRAISFSFGGGYFNSPDTLAESIINQINLPIRKRRNDKNED